MRQVKIKNYEKSFLLSKQKIYVTMLEKMSRWNEKQPKKSINKHS